VSEEKGIFDQISKEESVLTIDVKVLESKTKKISYRVSNLLEKLN
jgi:hypothetical protein